MFKVCCPLFGAYVCKSNSIGDFTNGLDILGIKVKAVEEPLKCASNELTPFVMYTTNWVGVKREPKLDKLVLYVM